MRDERVLMFDPSDAPRCKTGLEVQEIATIRHNRLSLECQVDAVPDEAVRFSWAHNSTREEVSPMQNLRVENKGLVSTLEYTPSKDQDFGPLACWASNSVGRQTIPCIFNIVLARESQLFFIIFTPRFVPSFQSSLLFPPFFLAFSNQAKQLAVEDGSTLFECSRSCESLSTRVRKHRT